MMATIMDFMYWICVLSAVAMILPNMWTNYRSGISNENVNVAFILVGAVCAGDAPIFLRYFSNDITTTGALAILITLIWGLILFFLGDLAWETGKKKRSRRSVK